MGDTDIMWAVKTGDLDVVKDKVHTPEEVNRRLANGRMCLHISADFGQVNVAEYLIAKGADVNAVDDFGLTPLLSAVMENHIDCVKLLLKKGADKNFKGPDGKVVAECAESTDMKALLQ